MSKKYFAVVGYWSYNQDDPMGISSYKYDPETGEFTLVETIRRDIVSGTVLVKPEKKMIYVADEIGHVRGNQGGGGYVRSFSIDPETGRLTLTGEQLSLSPEPCAMCLDTSGKYLLASHMSDPFHVTKIHKHEDGTFSSETLYDDTAVVVFKINEDGSLGEVCDVAITENGGATGPNSRSYIHEGSGHMMMVQIISRLRSVAVSADGVLYAVADRGMDRIYTFRLDRAEGKLERLFTLDCEVECQPRDARFHPTLPYMYATYSQLPYIDTFTYNVESGELTRIARTPIAPENPEVHGGSVMLIHPNGRVLYCPCSTAPHLISVFDIHEDGTLEKKQTLPCGGINNRTLALSPDARFLFSGNNQSHNITRFAVQEDGTLIPDGEIESITPSSIQIFAVEA